MFNARLMKIVNFGGVHLSWELLPLSVLWGRPCGVKSNYDIESSYDGDLFVIII